LVVPRQTGTAGSDVETLLTECPERE